MTGPYVVGLDVGSTYIKAVLLDAAHQELAAARRSSPWRSLSHGRTEMDPADLLAAVVDVLADLARQCPEPVTAIGVSGMAESGALLEADDRVLGPVIAWFDQRGAEELPDLPADLRAEFAGRTGLPLGPLATFAKLWHRHCVDGLDLAGKQWLNVPELVTWWLGGDRLSEVSLVARTGLMDQDTGELWPRTVEVLGADTALLPPVVAAGHVWGLASRNVPATMSGAVLTVAGHDHLVSSTASGVLDLDTLYDSMGTAEALVRVLDGVLDSAARTRLADHGVNVVRHMLPGRGVMLAGTKAGLLMRRVLQLVGVNDAAGREALDDQVMLLTLDAHGESDGLRVSGATNVDGVLAIRADADGLSPALLVEATLRHGSDVLAEVLARMDAENPPAVRTVVAGGWSRMRCVRRARQDILPSARFSERDEDTAFGAALVAAFAADPEADDLVAHLSQIVHQAATPGGHAGTAPHQPTPEGIPQ